MSIIPWNLTTKPLRLLNLAFHSGSFHFVSNRWQHGLPGADPRPVEKGCTSYSMEPVQVPNGSLEPLHRAEQSLVSNFLTQVMFLSGSLAGWAGVLGGCAAAWRHSSVGMSSAQRCGNLDPLKGLYIYFHGY